MTHSIKCEGEESYTFVHKLTVQNKLARTKTQDILAET